MHRGRPHPDEALADFGIRSKVLSGEVLDDCVQSTEMLIMLVTHNHCQAMRYMSSCVSGEDSRMLHNFPDCELCPYFRAKASLTSTSNNIALSNIAPNGLLHAVLEACVSSISVRQG